MNCTYVGLVAKNELSGQFVENSGLKRKGEFDSALAFFKTNYLFNYLKEGKADHVAHFL